MSEEDALHDALPFPVPVSAVGGFPGIQAAARSLPATSPPHTPHCGANHSDRSQAGNKLSPMRCRWNGSTDISPPYAFLLKHASSAKSPPVAMPIDRASLRKRSKKLKCSVGNSRKQTSAVNHEGGGVKPARLIVLSCHVDVFYPQKL